MSQGSVLYPREVICGGCGVAIILGWHNPMELSQGGTPVYEHPDNHCEFKDKRLVPTGLVAVVDEDEF
jgi:hypothetical protein